MPPSPRPRFFSLSTAFSASVWPGSGNRGFALLRPACAGRTAQIFGGEFGATWKPHAHWRLGASAAYAWGRNADTGAPLPQIPPLDARFTLAYSHGAW